MLKGTQLFSPLTHLNEDVDNDERNKERASVMVVMYSDEKKKKKKFVELSKRLPAEDRRGDSIKKKEVCRTRRRKKVCRTRRRKKVERKDRSLDDEPYCKKNFI